MAILAPEGAEVVAATGEFI